LILSLLALAAAERARELWIERWRLPTRPGDWPEASCVLRGFVQ